MLASGNRIHRALIIAACLAAPAALGGCKSVGLSDITGSIAPPDTPAKPNDEDSIRRYTELWGKRYDANPTDKATAIRYAYGLRRRGQYAQAVAILQDIAIKNPKDLEVLGAYGKALADAGRYEEANEVLQRANPPERPNWSLLSAQGSIADRVGDHATAEGYYREALKISPNEPAVLSNLGLSYALSKNLPKAEETLRLAASQPRADARVRQNLALVLALEGKFTEAEQLGETDLSPQQAEANVTAVRQMVAQSDTWRDLRDIDHAKAARPAAKTAAREAAGKTAVARRAPASPTQPAPAAAADISPAN